MTQFSTTISPRFYETDALGHINNAAIAAWFEVARMRLMESLGSGSLEGAMNWVLASIQIDFIAETFYGADVVAVITEAKAGNSSLTVVCEMSQNDKVTVRGTAVMVFLDAQEKKPAPIPEIMRRKLGSQP